MSVNLAIAGATGAVGREMLEIVRQRRLPVNEIKLLASSRSVGKTFSFNSRDIPVEELNDDSFEGINIALFSAGSAVSKEFAPVAVKAGAVVIDNSSAFRMEPNVPLVVPEINGEEAFKHNGIIANPNCSTVQMVMVLKPIHDLSRIKRVIVTTFQSVSGTGQKAIDELDRQTKQIINGQSPENNVYPHQIAFNVIPQIDDFLENGFTKEETKMTNETRKILGDDNIAVSATTVRVPVFRGHSESVYIETEKALDMEDVRNTLANFPGISVIDDPENVRYPMPVHAAGKDDCYVGRLRKDIFTENGLHLWIVSDNLRKGAALNAVQIAELLIKEKRQGR